MKTPARIEPGSNFDPLEVWPFQDEDRHFCSGVNSPGEVDGLASSGGSIGITATEIRGGLLEALERHAGGMVEVFVDSGAFSEVKFGKPGGVVKVGKTRTVTIPESGRAIVKPITDADWLARFDVYREVARAFRSRAFIVAPDAVGDQLETLRRMERWAHVVRGLALHYRVNVIVPVQRGEIEPVDFLIRALLILQLPKDQIVIGVPSKKSATSPTQLNELAAELKAQGVCAPFHLLGMGPKSPSWDAMRGAIRAHLPDAVIYSDAVGVRREAGRTNGPGGTPRRMTLAQDRARARGITGFAIKTAAIWELGRADSRSAAQAARRAGWYDPELESVPGVPFLLDDGSPCLSYGPGGPFGDGEHQTELALDCEAA